MVSVEHQQQFVYIHRSQDRFYASIMGAYAADIICAGKTNRVVGYQHGEFMDFDIDEALAMQKDIPDYQYQVSKLLSASL